MWEIGKSLADSREGVRPHRRLHPRHHRGAEGAGQQQLALRHRRGHDRPDPAHAARRRAVHGAVQLSAQRDLRDADPGPDHGQHHGVQAAEATACCCSTRCCEAFRSAFPKGVINTVYGQGSVVVPRLLGSGKVNVLTLIGSSKVADHLKKLHPKAHRLRAILGLDAKNAAIVLPDADIELAVKECLLGSLSFNGQRCTALKMLIVHRSIAEPFLRRFSRGAGQAEGRHAVGEGRRASRRCRSPARSSYMTELVEDAMAKGARVVNEGGGTVAGTLFYPAVVYPVGEGMKLYREEQFGPVVPVMPFEDIETRAANTSITSEHGQQVSIFSADPDRIGDPGRSAGQPGLPRQHQLPVPARPGRVPVHRPQGLGRGHAVGDRRAALVLDPLDDRGQADRRRASSCSTRSSSSTSRTSSTRATSSESPDG